jgi:hypothetical protein
MSLSSEYTQGMGGLKFIATAPPGQGRLCRIPFYLNTDQGNAEFQVLEAGAILQNSSSVSPIIACGSNTTGISASSQLKTPEISWATLRLVGFEVNINYPSNPGGSAAAGVANAQGVQNNTVQVMVKDLQIGGGATLFVHEDFANASIYSSSNDSFAGLRDYPLIKSPNVAQVNIALFQNSAGATPTANQSYLALSSQVVVSMNLVVEILQDDNYGAHMPGPYARKSAMVRRG